MTSELKWIPLEFSKGLNQVDTPSALVDGECAALENFQWLPNGGITPRPAWKAAGNSPTSGPTGGQGRGAFTGWYESGVRKLVFVAYDGVGNHYLYKTNLGDPTLFTTYTNFDTQAVSANYRPLPLAFAAGAGKLLYTNPGFGSAQIRRYDGTTVVNIGTNDIAGRCIAYHLNRFFTGGSIAFPSYLRWSEPGLTDTWNVSTNFIPVGLDDGEPIEDIAIWDQGMFIGKAHGLWVLSGSTVETFALHPLSDRYGVAPGRTLCPSSFGVFFLGVDGCVYLYDGGDVKRVSAKVTPPVFSTYATLAFIGDQLYVCAATAGTTIYVYDPKGDRWRFESMTDLNQAPQDLVAYDDRYLVSTATGTARFNSVRQEIGAFANGTYRDPQPDIGVAGNYVATTGQRWPLGAVGKATVREVYIRYRQWFGQVGVGLVVTPVVDGVEITAQAKTIPGKAAAGDYAARLNFNALESASRSGRNFALKFSSAPNASQDDTYAIAEVLVGVLADRGSR